MVGSPIRPAKTSGLAAVGARAIFRGRAGRSRRTFKSLNDLYREAAGLGLRPDGVRVAAEGGFDEDWGSTGVTYHVELDSAADRVSQQELLDTVDRVAEIPKALRASTTVTRVA